MITHAGLVLNARFAPLPDGSTMAVFSNITASQRVSLQFAERSFSQRFGLAVRDHVADCMIAEVRDPLAQLGERSDLAGQEAGGVEPLLSEIRNSVHRMDDLVQLVELCDSTPEPHRAPVDVNDTVRTVAALLLRPSDEAEVTLAIQIAENARHVLADSHAIHRIWFAIGLYLIEQSEAGTQVTMWAEVDEDGATLCADAHGEQKFVGSIAREDPDRMLIEYLVEQQGGVLEVSEIQATGAVRISARFDERVPEEEVVDFPEDDSEALDEISDDANSNVLRLPAVGSRE